MPEIKNSALLDKILHRAESLCRENDCSGLNREYIVVAALSVMDDADAAPAEKDLEYAQTRKLLEPFSRDKGIISQVLEVWRNKQIGIMEVIALSTQKKSALSAAMEADLPQLPADLYLSRILSSSPAGIRPLLKKGERIPVTPPPVPRRTEQEPVQETKKEVSPSSGSQQEAAPAPARMSEIIDKVKALQARLQDTVLGQDFAVSTFASGYFQSELQACIDKDRVHPRSTFLFAGPPGVGKTFLSEEAARVLDLPFRRFDMSEYTGPNSTDELAGSDKNYKGSSEGQLTGFVAKNPHCVLLFDEIEKASLETIHLFLQVLDAGRLRDNRTDKEVSFKDTILIFTTNAGKALYEGDLAGNLSSLSRDVILDALSKDINPRTQEPFFPAAICSRFASGNVIMFNHLEAHTLREIVRRGLDRNMRDLSDSMGIQVTMTPDIPTALLLAEGAAADARTVKSRANSFFSGELYELFRLLPSGGTSLPVDKIRSIHFSVNMENEQEEIRRLFSPAERIHALAYARNELSFDSDDLRVPVIHTVHSVEEAKEVIDRESVQLIFCDLFSDEITAGQNYLHREDKHSVARDFLHEMLKQYPNTPIILTEDELHVFSEEERTSYLRRGVRGFLSLQPDGLTERVAKYTESIFQQNSLFRLARSNQLVRFETAQSVSPAGDAADILIFDMKLEKAVKAEDANNIMSMLSTPDVKFDDVIGAQSAKDELKFFVSYMKNPKKYQRQGLSAPKGILLYGPPGTGKTMLAKAFAAESGATFIAAQGNQFHRKYIGEGQALVHQLFAAARRYAPSVLFVDEIDTIARARTGEDTASAESTEQIMTAFFAEMDGFEDHSDRPVFVLGATNYSVEPGARMALDPAMLRRFDRRILIDLPGLENRKAFLEKEIAKKAIFQVSPKGIASLVSRSTGMSLAQLSSILDLALRSAMQKQADHITDAMLDEAFETFNSGDSKKRSEEASLRTARHEAGHTLLAWLAGDKPSYVTIVSRSNFGGYMQHANQEEKTGYTRQELLGLIRTALGGRASEIVFYGKEGGLSTGPSSDLRTATELSKQLLCSYGMEEDFGLAVVDPNNEAVSGQVLERINALLREQLAEAIRLITEHRKAVDKLVEQLLEHNSLQEQDIDNILSGNV